MRPKLSLRRWIWLPVALALGVTAVIWAAPLGAASNPKPAAVDPAGAAGCQLSQTIQPALAMNTVVQDNLFKTVAMEKEVFNCKGATGQQILIRDVETFIEIVQSGRQLVGVTARLAICNKSFQNFNVHCAFRPVQIGQNPAPLQACVPQPSTSTTPSVVMNTEISKVVKTIKVEKEIFRCDDPARGNLRDLYLFTETIEIRQAVAGQPPTYKPVLDRFIGIVCYKDEQKGLITGCDQFKTS